MMLSDFHIHSNFSDGKHSIPEIVDFYGKQGFQAIAITDHVCETNTFLGKAAGYLERTLTKATFPIYLEILKSERERAWKQYRMLLITGIEVTKNFLSNHRSAHILGLSITEWVDPNASIEEICAEIKRQNGVTVAAHPVSTQKLEKQTLHLWDRRQELAPLFDAWEVGTGVHFFDEVARANVPMLANTDLHRFSQMTGWKTVVNTHRSNSGHLEAFLDGIRKQSLSFHYYQSPETRDAPSALPHRSVEPVPFPNFLNGTLPKISHAISVSELRESPVPFPTPAFSFAKQLNLVNDHILTQHLRQTDLIF